MDVLRLRRFLSVARAIAIGGLLLLPAAGSAQQASREQRIKIAFLYNFALFADWEHASGPPERFEICFLGDNPYATATGSIDGKQVRGGRVVRTRQVASERSVDQCHILFVGAPFDSRIEELSAEWGQLELLTVAESQGFAAGGGMIEMGVEKGRITLTINNSAAAKQGLRLSSKLLMVAIAVL